MPHANRHQGTPRRGAVALLVLAALGVIYGDIGTSPLYAFQAAFGPDIGLTVDEPSVLGALSLFVWALIIVVTIKYVIVVMRASNNGEGGTLALGALVEPLVRGRRRALVIFLSMLAIALFAADAVLTPSVSVLSAIEGASLINSGLQEYETEIALVILTLLFMMQRWGTGSIGRVFGPIMLLWFTVISALGIVQIVQNPSVLRAISPTYAIDLALREPTMTFLALGAVTLAITGVEALYADMGHFGRPPITISWSVIVFPALVLCYLGQGALVLDDPRKINNPFYALVPDGLMLPMVVLATLATVIASQAVITGMYSLTQQAMQMGFLPRLPIVHTSKTIRGQINIPVITLIMFIGVAATVLIFQSSSRLVVAYGLTVTGTLICTTILAAIVARTVWRWSPLVVALVYVPLGVVDILFFSSNVIKIVHGAWFTVSIAVVIFFVVRSWSTGRDRLLAEAAAHAVPLDGFLATLPPSARGRLRGTGVFLVREPEVAPGTLMKLADRTGGIYERTLIVSISTTEVPVVPEAERAEVVVLQHGVQRIALRFGFTEQPDVPAALGRLALGEPFDPQVADYLIGRDSVAVKGRGLRSVPLYLFAAMHRFSQGRPEFFGVPPELLTAIGRRIELTP
ncbi:MAG: KUP/HAK/KT family potassium transporter [Thermoleophilia bacterium]